MRKVIYMRTGKEFIESGGEIILWCPTTKIIEFADSFRRRADQVNINMAIRHGFITRIGVLDEIT